MNKVKIETPNGIIDGLYCKAAGDSPLVIITNGHNGFYNYGMFPFIQKFLQDNAISSYSYNFTHGGVKGDADFFEDLDAYQKNCVRLEFEDLCNVLDQASVHFPAHKSIFLLAHSMGSVPTIFAVSKYQKLNALAGAILYNPVANLDFWPADMIRVWEKSGVYYLNNNRTKQELPQGEEFLTEILGKKWDVLAEAEKIDLPVLILHGDKDEAISMTHGQSIYQSLKANNSRNRFIAIENGSHTFNTKHPFEGCSPQLETALEKTVEWIRAIDGVRTPTQSQFPALPKQKSRLEERKSATPYYIEFRDLKLLVGSGVYKTGIDTELMADMICPVPNGRFLEIGCGTGAISLVAAKKFKTGVAVDVNQLAVLNTMENCRLNGIDNLDVYKSDVFENVSGLFDVIICNPPYNMNRVQDDVDRMFWDPQNSMKKTFFSEVSNYLKPEGSLYFGWANFSDLDYHLPLDLAGLHGFVLEETCYKPSRCSSYNFIVYKFKKP